MGRWVGATNTSTHGVSDGQYTLHARSHDVMYGPSKSNVIFTASTTVETSRISVRTTSVGTWLSSSCARLVSAPVVCVCVCVCVCACE